MSDFLARLAARSIAATSQARPRLPSMFEGSAIEPGGDDAPGAPGRSAGDRANDAGLRRPPLDAGRPGSRSAAVLGMAARSDGRSPQPPAPDPRARVAADAVAAAVDGGSPLVPEPLPREGVGAPELPRPAPREVGPSEVTTSAVFPGAAMAGPWSPESLAPTPGDRVRNASAEAPVTVHIGRLEVRAIVAEPPPPRERGRETRHAEHEPLSLSDYLRGRRASP